MLRRTSGLFMHKTSVVAFIPGAYLVATRYPGYSQVVGFFWLETLPFTGFLFYSIGIKALWFPVLHWLFLGLYELGYLFNDSAKTATERSGRPALSLAGGYLFAAVTIRLAALLLVVALWGRWIDYPAALNFAVASVVIVALLFFHTYIGARQSIVARLRVVSFAALAFGKYAPAALALASMPIVVQGLVWIFLLYGAGRVLDYSLSKVWGNPAEMMDVNALWYLAVLFPAIGLISYEAAGEGALASLCVFGAYYLVAILKRSYRR